MPVLEFSKYEGLGNDFIVVEAEDTLPRDEVIRLCDRHFGIGADGVLVVASGASGSRARMIVQNADGSRPEMCGNGLRCVALHLSRRDGVSSTAYMIDTDAGQRHCIVERDGRLGTVLIDLGRAKQGGTERARIDASEYVFTQVSIGNPHAIAFGDIPEPAEVDRIGPVVSSQVPGGTNVEFVARRGAQAFELVVWERGVGRTLACGTGAGATAAALAFAGHAPFDAPIEIRLPGGALDLWVASGSHEVKLRGPARWVFDGKTSAGGTGGGASHVTAKQSLVAKGAAER